MFNINPAPMQDEKQYAFHAKLMKNIVDSYQNYESGEMYDDPIESGYLKLRHFEDSVLNDIFEMFVDKFL